MNRLWMDHHAFELRKDCALEIRSVTDDQIIAEAAAIQKRREEESEKKRREAEPQVGDWVRDPDRNHWKAERGAYNCLTANGIQRNFNPNSLTKITDPKFIQFLEGKGE